MKIQYLALLMGILISTSALANLSYEAHVKRLKKVTIRGEEIAYVDEGQGPAVVLMHGIPTSSWMFRKIIPLLVRKGHRVIAPDLLGFGSSQRSLKKLTVKGEAEIVLELLTEKLSLTAWTHVVHDFGGPISWEMMEDSRFAANRLVVLDTFAFEAGWNPGMNAFMRGLVSAGTKIPGVKKIFFHQTFKGMVADQRVADKEMLEGYCAPMLKGGARSYRDLLFSVNQLKRELPRYQRTLSSLTIPSVIVWGEKDEFLTAREQMPEFQKILGLSDEDVTVLKGTKHLITEERPELIAEKISP